ncbi:MAG: BlaI/MecI/CopY family transcriptional regulator [Oscillospiraceae bacterium]|nr:BlaI/MecI/CopY family transcriptional regulator [Oscillospiraceae bacterium]
MQAKEAIALSDGEWKLMNRLWSASPQTVPQLVRAMAQDTGWSRATIFIMLGRMEEKGAVRMEQDGRAKRYYAAVPRDQITAQETARFLEKVYQGSLQMMVSSMAGQNALSREDIDELYEILRQAEQEAKS